MEEGKNLKALGSKTTGYQYKNPSSDILEVFDNQYPENQYTVKFETEEFTSLCPKTGQPDFARIVIEYEPRLKCIETKSLKLYLFAYRDEGTFMETITNRIMNDCVKACSPEWMTVTGDFRIRGGIALQVSANYYPPVFEDNPSNEISKG